MSEEEVKENVEETPEVGEQEESENPIFNALFKAVEGEGETEEEEQEEFTPPSSLQSALHDIEQGVEPEEQEEATEETPDQSETEETAPQAKKRVARKKKIVDPDFTSPTRSAKPSGSPEPKPSLDGLNVHEKERYNLAKWASDNIEGYKGKDAEYLKFFKEHKSYLERRLKEDPDVEFNEDEDYKRFLASNRPQFHAEQVKNTRLQREAERNAIDKLTPEIQAQKKELQRLKVEPQTRKAKAESRKMVAKAIPQDVMDGFRNNPDYSKTHALESRIVDRILGEANSMADAFHDIASDLVDFDGNNPVHVRLSQWINQEQDAFIQSGKTKKQGKTFIRRERYPNVPNSDRDKYYTFSDSDIINLLAQRAGTSMRQQIDKNLSELEASGFTRSVARKAKSQVPVNKQPAKSPSPSPRPGPSVESSAPNPEENKVLSLLGL